MQEIDPKEVPRMFKEGKLWHGVKLQFRLDTSTGWTKPLRLLGFDPVADPIGQKCFWSSGHGWFKQARFPLPELKINDPVIVWNGTGKEYKRYFKQFDGDMGIICFSDGTTSWTATGDTPWDYWRLPRPDELP